MLDESMFEDIHEIAENSAYLKAVEERDVCLDMYEQLPSYTDPSVKEMEDKLRLSNKLTFEGIFNEAIGYYFVKCFLLSDYAVDKACFIRDVNDYKKMRFESARKKVSKLIYQRFVSTEYNNNINTSQYDQNNLFNNIPDSSKKGLSVFQLIQLQKQNTNNDNNLNLNQKNILEPSNIMTKTQNYITSNNTNNNNNAHIQHHNVVSQNHQPSISHINSTQHHINTVSHNAVHTDLSNKRMSNGQSINNYNNIDNINNGGNMLQIGVHNNAIGVYGPAVRQIAQRVHNNEAPPDLFDIVAREVWYDLKFDMFPRFIQSEFYHKYLRCKYVEYIRVNVKDFTTFRVLGRGGFGAVHACRKKNSGTIYAMKCINKKLVKVKSALENVLEERNVLTVLNSPFVTNLKYALADDESLYLIMDLMLGGDLKFHLINAGRFTEKRARFYAAQVLLGLEQLHNNNIVYRDMKLENVLLDHNGNCRISDLGLAVVTKVKIKGYAGM